MAKHLTTLLTSAALLLTTAALGCKNGQSKPPIAHGEKFENEGVARSTGNIAQAQAAAGAAADGMLYERNFRGAALNSLGQSKLDLIVKGTPTGDPVVVYLNMPHEAAADRRVAIVAFLKNAGVKDNAIKLNEGANPNDTTPTAYNLAGIYKGKDGSFTGETADETVSTLARASATPAGK